MVRHGMIRVLLAGQNQHTAAAMGLFILVHDVTLFYCIAMNKHSGQSNGKSNNGNGTTAYHMSYNITPKTNTGKSLIM